MSGVCGKIGSTLFEYETLKVVHIRSKKVGFINRLIQLVVICYVIGYAIVYEKGYQDTDLVTSGVTAKLKGVAYTDLNSDPAIGERIWDMADYHIPPQQSSAFYVMTNMHVTPFQKNGTCAEKPSIKSCTNGNDCAAGELVPNGDGRMTGNCVQYNNTEPVGRMSCQIMGWCPVEDEDPTKSRGAVLEQDARNFTVFIKNSIEFKKFTYKARNINDDVNNRTYLEKCNYHPDTDAFCPIFRLEDIFRYAGILEQWPQATKDGAVMAIDILWNCNLDSLQFKCAPEYKFRRVDNPAVKLSPGFNFRFGKYYKLQEDGQVVQYRDLTKSYGVLFLINVEGEAGKFSPVPLFINLGTGLALLSVATVLCDFITLNLLKKRTFYREKKYEDVDVDDGFTILKRSHDDSTSIG
eukprot:scpid72722/ scgid16433/ P2X purinoceptor 4; ATP receptor; Purinergic receptor